ncbi:MAG: hypothetical protein A2275_02275 [Bacteroidetes bacterium RIFOXYA12_FULL_35_11]|nr:MAG: hypothetical protein A2275_02275 [Bacteroidetes bacterium RIFOXYA12_FULL_35_11]
MTKSQISSIKIVVTVKNFMTQVAQIYIDFLFFFQYNYIYLNQVKSVTNQSKYPFGENLIFKKIIIFIPFILKSLNLKFFCH